MPLRVSGDSESGERKTGRMHQWVTPGRHCTATKLCSRSVPRRRPRPRAMPCERMSLRSVGREAR
eukprot:4311547-Pyramimonas_sp.AAC.1